LAIQLDDHGRLLERWQELMLRELRKGGDGRSGPLAAVGNWGGRAVPDSVGYRLVRTFRSELIGLVYEAFSAPMRTGEGGTRVAHRDESGRRARVAPLSERPAHLVPPGYADWDAVVAAGLTKTLASVEAQPEAPLRLLPGAPPTPATCVIPSHARSPPCRSSSIRGMARKPATSTSPESQPRASAHRSASWWRPGTRPQGSFTCPRPERPSAVALLQPRTRGLGGRPAVALPARRGAMAPDNPATTAAVNRRHEAFRNFLVVCRPARH
jgi:penicillin amidase